MLLFYNAIIRYLFIGIYANHSNGHTIISTIFVFWHGLNQSFASFAIGFYIYPIRFITSWNVKKYECCNKNLNKWKSILRVLRRVLCNYLDLPAVDDQTRRKSNWQPVSSVQLASSSSLVHRRPPWEIQKVLASSQLRFSHIPQISDSAHTEHDGFFHHPLICVSEQQRTGETFDFSAKVVSQEVSSHRVSGGLPFTK